MLITRQARITCLAVVVVLLWWVAAPVLLVFFGTARLAKMVWCALIPRSVPKTLVQTALITLIGGAGCALLLGAWTVLPRILRLINALGGTAHQSDASNGVSPWLIVIFGFTVCFAFGSFLLLLLVATRLPTREEKPPTVFGAMVRKAVRPLFQVLLLLFAMGFGVAGNQIYDDFKANLMDDAKTDIKLTVKIPLTLVMLFWMERVGSWGQRQMSRRSRGELTKAAVQGVHGIWSIFKLWPFKRGRRAGARFRMQLVQLARESSNASMVVGILTTMFFTLAIWYAANWLIEDYFRFAKMHQ